jgi:hypothetical protein
MVEHCYANCHLCCVPNKALYVECRYAECHYAERRDTSYITEAPFRYCLTRKLKTKLKRLARDIDLS